MSKKRIKKDFKKLDRLIGSYGFDLDDPIINGNKLETTLSYDDIDIDITITKDGKSFYKHVSSISAELDEYGTEVEILWEFDDFKDASRKFLSSKVTDRLFSLSSSGDERLNNYIEDIPGKVTLKLLVTVTPIPDHHCPRYPGAFSCVIYMRTMTKFYVINMGFWSPSDRTATNPTPKTSSYSTVLTTLAITVMITCSIHLLNATSSNRMTMTQLGMFCAPTGISLATSRWNAETDDGAVARPNSLVSTKPRPFVLHHRC